MNRINTHTVELTPREDHAFDYYHRMLDRGLSCLDALQMTKLVYGTLEPEFISWLID